MSSILKSTAAANVNRGVPSTFYSNDKPNPVFQALEQEIIQFMSVMKKRFAEGSNAKDDETKSRVSSSLFELWNKYEPRLPQVHYQEKILEMGDFLMSIKEYSLALWQCYCRYLRYFGHMDDETITDVETFRKTYFPDGFKAKNIGFTFRALMGKSISMYQMVKKADPKLQNKQSVDKCVEILSFLRLVMQVVLPKESLCWLVYNGTVHVYSISRHMMSTGNSARVLEFLLWASVCMETSVPLLATRYLVWRTTLYTAVCQCYYDCKAGEHAESFARRGLAKINELRQLEEMSSTEEDAVSQDVFRQATVKMAIMVFKRSVFETRKKPKGILRPRTRANLKDSQGLPWPRTPTEKLLAEMFEGSAAQFLCVLESMNDSNRRALLNSQPAPDSEVEVLDVFAELFMAAHELLSGGGGSVGGGLKPPSSVGISVLAGVVTDQTLINMATEGEDGIPLSAAVRIVKLAYCYESWDTFDALVEPVLSYIRLENNPTLAADEKALELLVAMERAVNSRRHKHRMSIVHEDDAGQTEPGVLPLPPSHQGSSLKSSSFTDELILLSDVLMSIVNGPFSPQMMDIDMIVDAGLYLWTKCKTVFQKYQTGSVDNPKFLQKMDNPNKWVYILDIVHQVLCWCGISSVDPGLTAEVVLRLSLVLESLALGDPAEDARNAFKESRTTMSDGGADTAQAYISRNSTLVNSIMQLGSREQLLQARDILELGLNNVSFARQAVALTDGKSIADVGWVKDFNPELFAPEPVREGTDLSKDSQTFLDPEVLESYSGSSTAVWNTIKDLHLELIMIYHRVCLKLVAIGPDLSTKAPKIFKRRTCSKLEYGSDRNLSDSYIETFDELSACCNKNHLSKALLYMQRALSLSNKTEQAASTQEQKTLLQDAVGIITKAQLEEKRLYQENAYDASTPRDLTRVPLAPKLLSRTDTTMVFKPSPFQPQSGEKPELSDEKGPAFSVMIAGYKMSWTDLEPPVAGDSAIAWYRLFGRSATGSNIKARLNDYLLPGTGEQIPSDNCEIMVSGLTPNERYVFAVAAYTSDGKLIGNGVGDTCRAILAAHPLPVLMTWAFLSQIAYQVGCYDIARQACGVLWRHFVAAPPLEQTETYISSEQRDFKLTLFRLNQRVVCLASPVLLRQFLTSIFINVDIKVRDGELFCDVLCDKGPLYVGQISRLSECQKMLVAMEMAGWLNEPNLALQAVVQCYGLLCPLIFYKIPSVTIIQILQHCHAVLQEIPAGLRQKRQANITDSLHHMTACITYHLAKVLRTWGQKSLANSLNEAGRKLLALDTTDSKEPKGGESAADRDKVIDAGTALDNITETGSITLQALKKKKVKRLTGKEEPELCGNEELKALEAHILSQSKQAHGDHDSLSGNEDPSILHAYIAFLPSKTAYKEVVKFKKRIRYLEFFIQVAQKALTEGLAETAIEWCDDTAQWIVKRNEQINGHRGKQSIAVTVAGDEPKKFAAAMVEYSKEKEREVSPPRGKTTTVTKQTRPKKKPRLKSLATSNFQKMEQEEKEAGALDVLGQYLPDLTRSYHRRRRFRKICSDELPWKSQLNILQGMCHFTAFLQKLERREKALGTGSSNMFRTSFLDQEWFTLEMSGTLVVGWEGGPARLMSMQDKPGLIRGHDIVQALDLADQDRPVTGIEKAAIASTVKGPEAPTRGKVESPRNNRSDMSYMRGIDRKMEQTASFISSKDSIEILTKTFSYFTKAVILAHRGQHWTLLQNACKTLWNCTHTTLMRAYTSSASGKDTGLLTMEAIRDIVWRSLHVASDCLLDMMTQLQTEMELQSIKAMKKKKKLFTPFESWMGSVADEKGGASLKFENNLDDISIADLRWIRRIVLRSLELLYYEEKWEKLVDIALRFSAVTNDRYAEHVIPLLVQAQRQLRQHLGDASIPQPHYLRLMSQLGGIVTAKDYIHSQLTIQIDKANLPRREPGTSIDPGGHNIYKGKQDAYQNISVPLDIPQSLQMLCAALDKSQYTSRALYHSRQLLVLYLAGQQNAGDSSVNKHASKVDFIQTTAQPPSTVPLDLQREEFLSVDDVQNSPIARSQLGTVISSYSKTIESLLAKNQRGLAAQAMHELGNLFYHSGNIRASYKWWAESLDSILNLPDCLHTWRQAFHESSDISADLLQRCGLWGCVLGGVLASNIAQYVLNSDLGLRMECCFLSGYLFKALFRSSLPHPMADRDYALYDIGEGCEVTNLVPGVDLLSDRFRSDGRQLVAALRWVTEELSRGRHNLFVLPLLTLYQYLTTFVCRDLQRCVDGRILKVRILTDLSLYSEAFTTLLRLLHGERLPHTGDSSFRQVESRMNAGVFNTSKPIMEQINLRVLETVLDKRLSSSLSTLFGPHLTCHLSLVQAHLLVSLADTLPVLPILDEASLTGDATVKPHTISTISRGGLGGRGPKLSSNNSSSRSTNKSPSDEDRHDTPDDLDSIDIGLNRRFTGRKKIVTLEAIKAMLIMISDQIVTTVCEVILESAEHDQGVEGLAAAELELVVLCKLEQAAVARQKHHAPMAARIMLSAIKILRNAHIFSPAKDAARQRRPSSMKGKKGHKMTQPIAVPLVELENSQFQYQNFQSRSRLDVRLWLDCRLALVKSLMMEIRAMGDVKGPDKDVLQELADCRQYCAEGLAESEACGDVEVQAEFFIQGALLNLMEGKNLHHTIGLLQDAMDLLGSMSCLSDIGHQLLATTMVLNTDLEVIAMDTEQEDVCKKSLVQYLKAQTIILKQMQSLGDKIEHYNPLAKNEHLSAPISPLQNLYLMHVQRLAQIKLRIGHAMARNAAMEIKHRVVSYLKCSTLVLLYTSNDLVDEIFHNKLSVLSGDHAVLLWSDALSVLFTSLSLCHVSVTREAALEAEILLNIGKVERQLVHLGKYSARTAGASLMEAIKTTYSTDHDLGLMHQAYLEMALIYLTSSGLLMLREGSILESVADSGDEHSPSKSPTRKKQWKSKKERARSRTSSQNSDVDDQERERRAAGIAIRCAAATAHAQRSRASLVGVNSVTSELIADKIRRKFPDFVCLDLLSPYVLGEKKKIYKDEIEEELAPMVEAQTVKVVETYDDQINKTKAEAKSLGWVHLLGYQTVLQRLCNSSTIYASSAKTVDNEKDEGHTDSPFDLQFISRAQYDSHLNHNVVHSMLLSGPWSVRINHLHTFLTRNLPSYAADCCAIYPPASLSLTPDPSFDSDLVVTAKDYSANLLYVDPDSDVKPQMVPGAQSEFHKPVDKSVTAPADEVCQQWYKPSLEETDQSAADNGYPSNTRIMLLYSLSKKGSGAGGSQPGLLWTSRSQLTDLHNRLSMLSQRGEISLVDKMKKEPSGVTPTPSKAKKAQRIKALSPRMQKDEQLEALLQMCTDDITVLMGGPPEQETTELPFDVTKANLQSLERLFDPSLGYTLKGGDVMKWMLKYYP